MQLGGWPSGLSVRIGRGSTSILSEWVVGFLISISTGPARCAGKITQAVAAIASTT